MYIINLETVNKMYKVWKKAGKLETAGCLFFQKSQVEKLDENNKDNDSVSYISNGVFVEEIPTNSRSSLPFSCSENNLSLNFHSHPQDKRNDKENFYFSPPSGADLKLRYILSVINENSLPFSIVLSEEGIYLFDTMLKLSLDARNDVKKFKSYFREDLLKLLQSIKININKSDKKSSVLKNNKIDSYAIATSISKLPQEDALNGLLIQCMPDFNEIFEDLINELQATFNWTDFEYVAKKMNISVLLFSYNKAIIYDNYSSHKNDSKHSNSCLTQKFLMSLNSLYCINTTKLHILEMMQDINNY